MAKTRFIELCEVNEAATNQRRVEVTACHDALKKLCRVIANIKSGGLAAYVKDGQADKVVAEPGGSISFELRRKVPTIRYAEQVQNGLDPTKHGREPSPLDLKVKVYAVYAGGKAHLYTDHIDRVSETKVDEFADLIFDWLKDEVVRKVSVAVV